jgi:hypothetical protein
LAHAPASFNLCAFELCESSPRARFGYLERSKQKGKGGGMHSVKVAISWAGQEVLATKVFCIDLLCKDTWGFASTTACSS